MITKVEIQNFQSHKHTVVDLVNGVNVIIGPSDAGKSSIFRAINWVVSNRPLGDSYRSEWGGDTKVVLHTSAGSIIERIRTDKRNSYIVNGNELKAFGSEPPTEIFEALQIDPYNVQSQMDTPFLMASSPGEAAQMLNKAASIDDIDRTIGGLKRDAGRIGRETNFTNEQLTKFKLQLSSYDYLDDLEDLVVDIEEGLKEYSEVKQDVTHLTDTIRTLQSLEQGLKRTEYVINADTLVNEALLFNAKYQELRQKYNTLVQLEEDLSQVGESLAQTKNVDKASTLIQAAEQTIVQMNTIATKRSNLKNLLDKASELEEAIKQLDNKTIARLTEEYNTLAPDTCPLCGNKMSKGV